jgi:hypothetical protein
LRRGLIGSYDTTLLERSLAEAAVIAMQGFYERVASFASGKELSRALTRLKNSQTAFATGNYAQAAKLARDAAGKLDGAEFDAAGSCAPTGEDTVFTWQCRALEIQQELVGTQGDLRDAREKVEKAIVAVANLDLEEGLKVLDEAIEKLEKAPSDTNWMQLELAGAADQLTRSFIDDAARSGLIGQAAIDAAETAYENGSGLLLADSYRSAVHFFRSAVQAALP